MKKTIPLGKVIISSQYGLSCPTNKDGGVGMVGMKNIINGHIDFSNVAKIEGKPVDYSAFLLRKGDLLVNRTNSLELIGKCGIVVEDVQVVFASYLVRLVADSDLAEPEYINYCLNSNNGQRRIRELATRAIGQVNINPQTLLKQLFIYLPAKSEQIKISALLKTWDSAIEKTERLIERSEFRQRALMQQLLSGSDIRETAREGWKVHRLGDLFSERIETDHPELPLLSITGEEGVVDRESTGRKDTSSEDKSKYLRIHPGDIGYNTMRMWQGVSALSSLEGIVSPAYTIITPEREIKGEYAAHLFKYPPIVNQFYRYSQGLTSDTWNLKFDNFSEITVRVPNLKQQLRVIQVLGTVIRERRLLQKQIEALSSQKSFLMSKLLTGEWEAPELKTR